MAERDARGRFVKGSQGGPGRPRGERAYLDVLTARASLPKWQQMVDKMVEMAIAGDVQAFRVLTSYLCGQPVQKLQLGMGDTMKLAEALALLREHNLSPGDIFEAIVAEVAVASEGDSDE